MKKNNIKFINIFLLFFLVLLFSSISSITTAGFSTTITYENPTLQALVVHGPIVIEYDENFTDYGFPGAGTPGDPYRIENYNITVSSDYPILFSGNQSKHFVIQDCFLKTDTNFGIYLGKYYDMADGIIKILNNVIISETNKGITIYGGKYSLVSGNTINASDDGISFYEDGDHSIFSYNTISSTIESGISVQNAKNITITKNTCISSFYGIYTYNCTDSIISHNNCSYDDVGIYLDHYSDNITVKNNIITNNWVGAHITNSDNNVVTNNLFQDNEDYAITCQVSTSNNIIHHNAFIDNNGGGIQASDNGANNVWYDTVALEGNYYSDWVSGSYSIDGTASSVDPYPLNYIPEISEYSSTFLAFIMILAFIAIPVINFVYRKKT